MKFFLKVIQRQLRMTKLMISSCDVPFPQRFQRRRKLQLFCQICLVDNIDFFMCIDWKNNLFNSLFYWCHWHDNHLLSLIFPIIHLHYTPFQFITNTQVAKRCFSVANDYFLILAVHDWLWHLVILKWHKNDGLDFFNTLRCRLRPKNDVLWLRKSF